MINPKELLLYTKNMTLLFAEDHSELRINTTEIFKNFFKNVDSVSDGEQALELYEAALNRGEAYDLVLTDIKMPKVDGIELTERIYEQNPSQILIVLSAHDDSQYLLPLINLGIEQFLKKPIDFQELLKVLLKTAKKINQPTEEAVLTEINLGDNFSYNKEIKTLSKGKENIYLTKYEILFLELTTQQLGKVYSNQDIVNYFTTLNEKIDPQNIRKLVSKLRKKLPVESLESIYGVGYRMLSISK